MAEPTEREIVMATGLMAVSQLIAESEGVAGLHHNGEVAPWDELLEGGAFDHWLNAFSLAMERVDEINSEASKG